MIAFPAFDIASLKKFAAVTSVVAAFAAAQALPASAQGNRQGQRPAQQQQQQEPEETEIDEIALTAKQVDAFIAAQKELAPITSRLKGNAQPSKQMMTQMENVAKKNGFKDFDEFGDVGANIGMVFGGIDPESKKYDPQALIQKEIAAVTADQKIPAAQKRKILQDLQKAAKEAQPLKYPGNADLVAQNYDRLKPVMMDEAPPPPSQGQPRQPPRR